MADVTLTAASVLPSTNAQIVEGVAGETITAGLLVYLLASTNEYMKADCTDASKDAVEGISLTNSIDGGPIKVQKSGNVTTAAELTAGTVYVLSAAGKFCPTADFSAVTDALTVIGAASSTTNLVLGITITSYGITG